MGINTGEGDIGGDKDVQKVNPFHRSATFNEIGEIVGVGRALKASPINMELSIIAVPDLDSSQEAIAFGDQLLSNEAHEEGVRDDFFEKWAQRSIGEVGFPFGSVAYEDLAENLDRYPESIRSMSENLDRALGQVGFKKMMLDVDVWDDKGRIRQLALQRIIEKGDSKYIKKTKCFGSYGVLNVIVGGLNVTIPMAEQGKLGYYYGLSQCSMQVREFTPIDHDTYETFPNERRTTFKLPFDEE